MSAPLLPLALWRRPILGNYFSTELALYASFRDYRCRRLRRRQPRPDDGASRVLQQHPLSRRTDGGGASRRSTRRRLGVTMAIRSRRHFRRASRVGSSSSLIRRWHSSGPSPSLLPPPPLARAQFVIRQLVRAKMKSLKKVACQSTKTSLARGSFGKGHWSLAVRPFAPPRSVCKFAHFDS